MITDKRPQRTTTNDDETEGRENQQDGFGKQLGWEVATKRERDLKILNGGPSEATIKDFSELQGPPGDSLLN
jgi:hypothetical protein